MTRNGKLSECFLGFSRTKMEKSRTWQFDGQYFNSWNNKIYIFYFIITFTYSIILQKVSTKNICYLIFSVYSLGPLVGKVKDYQVEVIVDTLCNNMVMLGFVIFFNCDMFFHIENVTSWIAVLASRLDIFKIKFLGNHTWAKAETIKMYAIYFLLQDWDFTISVLNVEIINASSRKIEFQCL